jgi:hypothetical protein
MEAHHGNGHPQKRLCPAERFRKWIFLTQHRSHSTQTQQPKQPNVPPQPSKCSNKLLKTHEKLQEDGRAISAFGGRSWPAFFLAAGIGTGQRNQPLG